MAGDRPALRLHGRTDECAALDRLISRARSAESQVLVLRGESGVGKTALLDHVTAAASGFRIARAVGVEAEVELAFAGLHQLCLPMTDLADELPAPQREALDTAFGRSAGAPPDRFLVGLAVLSLLAAATEDQPLLCVVDDAQWLDRVSAQTLAFVARRLLAEPVALVFAVRDGTDDELNGLPDLMIRGLSDGDARALLDTVIPGRLDERVRDRIVAEARGNPLALLELPRDPVAAEGGFGRLDTRPAAGHVEQSFMRRIESLPVPTQRLLLAAAAEPVGDMALLIRAAEHLGLSPDDAADAEAAGLIEIGARVRFRHPLIRSAAYRAADVDERRRVHRALALATDPHADPDRRAWHGANAAVGADEEVAAELERCADRAQARGGVAAAAAFLERAAELTVDPARRGTRALAAAQAKFAATSADAAYDLLAVAEMNPLDELQRAQAIRLRAQIAFVQSRGAEHATARVADTALQLLDAARGLEPHDAESARETYLQALGAAMYASRLCPHGGAVVVAEPARRAPPGPDPPRPNDLLLDGLAIRMTEGYAASLPALRAGLTQLIDGAQRGDPAVVRLFWQAFPVAAESATGELWDDDLWHRLAGTAVRLARDAGALNVLPTALATRAGVHVFEGELDAAATLLEEADAISAATGLEPLRYHSVSVAAWRGREADAARLIDTARRRALERGEGRVVGLTGVLSAMLYNGVGRYRAALGGARRTAEHDDLGFGGWTLGELVEAAVRCGERESALDALARLTERTEAAGTDWALGVLAMGRALVDDGRGAEGFYREAIDRLARTRIAVYATRAQLLYGEWLRREHRRVDAREQLGAAHEKFTRMGAEGFAERARRELLVTGETARRRAVGSDKSLTAQEAQIAELAGAGLTNQEIGAQLFISAHTVEWHLRKVFAKLAITSRRQLRGRFPTT